MVHYAALDEMAAIPQKISPRLITFDFGDTLVTSQPPYLERIAMGLTELGFPRSMPEVESAYHRADFRHSRRMLALAPFDNATFEEGFGQTLFEELGLPGDHRELRPRLKNWLLDFRPERVLMPGCRELLDRLAARGFRLGIISNNDGNTREKCAVVDIDRYFQFILDSTLERVMKPDRRIFDRALQQGGYAAAETLHVGDLWGCDILGAHAAGIPAAWLTSPYVQPPELPGVYRIGRLLDLFEVIAP